MSLSFRRHEHACFFLLGVVNSVVVQIYLKFTQWMWSDKFQTNQWIQLSLLLNGECVIYGKLISFIRKSSFVWTVGLVKVRVTKLLFNMGWYKPRVPAWLVPDRLSLSLPSCAQGVMGRRKARKGDFLPITPCSRRERYARTTGEESGSQRPDQGPAITLEDFNPWFFTSSFAKLSSNVQTGKLWQFGFQKLIALNLQSVHAR